MICQICGDEQGFLVCGRWWDSDDGWRWGALCKTCRKNYGHKKPKTQDYAYDLKNTLDVDQAIYETEGMIQ